MTTQILVVDDSALYRGILCDLLNDLPDVTIVGTAENGIKALEAIPGLRPDLVLLDINMPEMDGLETLKHIKTRHPKTVVVMVSSENRTQADITIKALSSGAYDFIAKPETENIEQTIAELKSRLAPLIQTIRKQAPSPQQSHSTSSVQDTPKDRFSTLYKVGDASSSRAQHFDIIAIAVSTGGPDALQKVIPHLPGNLNVPIVIVQHMPPVFTASLADHLDKRSQLSVKEAEAGEVLQANTVYIAPGGYHMAITGTREKPTVVIHSEAPENSCRPAADVLFRSLPPVYKGNILSIVLTGIGSDGCKGVESIKSAGGYCLSQNESSCVVYGMPRSVDEKRLSDESVDLSEMTTRIAKLVQAGHNSSPKVEA